jgi:S-DNA-T family DNA segregation ATPase FtsK/SpoIIIE
LPSEPGNGYLKIDTTNLVRFKGAYVSGPCPTGIADAPKAAGQRALRGLVPFSVHPTPSLFRIVEPDAADEAADAPAEPEEQGGRTLADVLIDRLTGTGPAARQVWLPPLSEAPSLDALLPSVVPDPRLGMTVDDPAKRGALRVPVGVVDRPYEQLRELLVADVSGADGHVAVVGAPQTGKSTLLRTFILSLALAHTPKQVQFYCLDFGGGGITSVSGLPHVGSVATRLDRDRVVRTIEELLQVMERRETLFAQRGIESMTSYRALRASGEVDDPHGDVFLVIDGWFSVKQDYSELESKINELASRGLSFGVHVVISATRWSEIRPWLRDLIGTRFELRLGDAMESEIGSRKAATVPSQPGRGIIGTGSHFLGALPRLDGSSDAGDLAVATKSAVEEIGRFWPERGAPPVRMLPTVLPVTELAAPEGDLRLCLGQDEQRLHPVWHDFGATPHLMVFGDSETGKTNLLRLVVDGVTRRYQPTQARIVLGDPQRQLDAAVPVEYRIGYGITADSLRDLCGKASVSLAKRVPGEDVTAERLRSRDWWDGPQLFVVVDDYDLLDLSGAGSPLDPLLSMLAQGVHIGLHVIVARSTSGAMRGMADPVLRRLWELGSPGVVLSYPKEEGRFLGEAAPRKLPPGRAQLVTRRGVRLVQTGYVSQEKLRQEDPR